MKSSLSTQLGQQLHLTPQLLQSIRLLQLDGLQLQQEITLALETNPLLERDDELSADEIAEISAPDYQSPDVVAALGQSDASEQSDRALSDYEIQYEPYQDESFSPSEDWSSSRTSNYEGDEDPLQRLIATDSGGLRQRVLEQLLLFLHAPSERAAAQWLVELVDDRGYLTAKLDDLRRHAEQHFGLDEQRFDALRGLLLHGDPTGYGAIDVRECLSAQLDELAPETAGLELAKSLVQHHLDRLAQHDEHGLCRELKISIESLKTAQRLILSLQPHPGEEFINEPGHYIIPDVRAVLRNGLWHASLNRVGTPRLRVNPVYEQLLGQADASAGTSKLRELMQEARWLTRGLAMRDDTLLRTATVIVDRQQGFLNRGEEAMLPMTLREIADAIGMHESTVSRITTGKYLQTPRGTFELKYFFSSKLDGAAVANTAIRAMVRRLIDAESPSAPLADDTIALMLARQGIHIARRTVAKYRDQLRIGPAKQRQADKAGKNNAAQSARMR